MIFHVTRTSIWSEKKPCDGVFQGKYTWIDTRTVDDPSKLFGVQKDQWYTTGENHRVEDGFIKRDLIKDGWMIEINTLEELLDFCKEIKEEIVLTCKDGTPGIEIYDAYRE
jgi:hypothetical protein